MLWLRQLVRRYAVELGFNVLNQTKIVTAASELGRNTLIHGLGGHLRIEIRQKGSQQGLCLTFEDRGPGIKDIEKALTDGFTTGKGMGLGLGGAKRLMNEFDISPREGGGTIITVTRWV